MEAHQRKDMVEPQAKTPSTAPDLTSIMVSSSSKQSVSPTGSQTKSIMNASGTSGAVVNNTPEPGLKRIPTVTFSDPKFASSITGKAVTPNNIKDDVIGPGAKLSKINTKFPLDPNEGPGVIYSPSSILSSSMDSVNGGGSVNINNVLSGAINLETSEPESASQKKGKEHPHFIVEDSLHTPRSRSNSSSPRPSVSLHTGSSGGDVYKRQLLEKCQQLWSKLKIPQSYIDTFMSKNINLSRTTLTNIMNELDKLQVMKKKLIKNLIEDAWQKIEEIWTTLQLSNEEKNEFIVIFQKMKQQSNSLQDDEILLERCEEEIKDLEAKLKIYAPVLNLIKEFQSLQADKIFLENSSKDSSRLLSRNSHKILLKEERTRKRVTRHFPRVIRDLKMKLNEAEEMFAKPFQINGEALSKVIEREEQELVKKYPRSRVANNGTSIRSSVRKELPKRNPSPYKIQKKNDKMNSCLLYTSRCV